MEQHSPISASPTKNARRRVPDRLRKRAALSCDFCKTRRRKCVRDSIQSTCKLCRENNLDCGSTIPRKPRTQPTTDKNISDSHYRAMENLISRLFPDIQVHNTEELIKLTRSVEDGSVVLLHDQLISATSATADVLNSSSSFSPSGADSGSIGPARSLFPTPEERTKIASSTANLYERVLQNPFGTLSYFGHSSSMAYVRKMREFLALGGKHDPASLPDVQQTLRDSFIQDRYSHTMGDGQDAVPAIMALDGRPPIGAGLDIPRPATAALASTRLAKLLEIFPSKQDTEELVELFFVHVHVNMPLFHRSNFQATLDHLRSPAATAIDAGWAVSIRLVLAFGCESRLSSLAQADHPESARLASLGRQLVSDSLAEIPQLMLSANLQSVTALTLFALYLSFANERNAAWILSGCAVRMSIGLGLHRSEDLILRSNIHLSVADRELRKQIWCSLYIFEQYTSSFFGRPSAVDGVEILVEPPKESISDLGFYHPPGLLSHDILLARIISKISRSQTDQCLQASHDCHGLPSLDVCHDLLEELDDWQRNLPYFLKFDESKSNQIYPNHLRQIVMMNLRYQYARMLLSRPFLLKALCISHVLKLVETLDQSITKYKQICVLAASESWMLIRCLWQSSQYNARLWLDGIFAYQCSLILSLLILDISRPSNGQPPEKLEQMVEEMQEILQKGPGNRTMTRLVQISLDFTKIVRSISLGRREEEYLRTTSQLPPEQLPTTHSQRNNEINIIDPLTAQASPFFNWDTFVPPDWFNGDSTEGNYWFDMSIHDFAEEMNEY